MINKFIKLMTGLLLSSVAICQGLPQGFTQTVSYNAPTLHVGVSNYTWPIGSQVPYVVFLGLPGCTDYPPLCINPADPLCIYLQDGTGVFGGADLSGMGSIGNPSKTWSYTIPPFLWGMTMKVQTICFDPSSTWSITNCSTINIGINGPDPNTFFWSLPSTWPSQTVPLAGADVVVPYGLTVTLDVDTPALNSLTIHGSLVVKPGVSVSITSKEIHISNTGMLICGTEESPHTGNVVFNLTGPRGIHTTRTEDNALDNDGMSRSIMVQNGGTLRLFGQVPPILKTRISDHIQPGATTFTVKDNVTWKAGNKIALSVTDFYGIGQTEILTLATDVNNSNTITVTSPIQTFRWGKLQYPLDTPISNNGLSLTPGVFTPTTPGMATVLDERATVVNLSRKIVIQGADDSDWTSQGFGVHVMVMGNMSSAQVSGVEIRRCGQRRAMGRYPFHWHMLSCVAASSSGSGGGAYIGDCPEGTQFLKNCSIWDSSNRAVTIHGTCGVEVDHVYAVNIVNHAFFMEDGNEMHNKITNCVAMKVRDGGANKLKMHDDEASGFWYTNPNNIFKGNYASDCEGRGIWNSFALRCFGLSRNSSIQPYRINIRLHEDNEAHSNAIQGIATEFVVNSESGSIMANRYDGQGQFLMSRNFVWKNNDGGYLNRVNRARYQDWVAADNNTRDFQGQTMPESIMEGTLFIGKSLNSATPFADPIRIGLASYHSTLNIEDIVAINYTFHPPTIASNSQFVYGGGVFDMSDMYDKAIGLGTFRNSGWRLINAHPGYKTPAPYFDGFPLTTNMQGSYRYWSLPGAVWDPHGYWSAPGNYLIVDNPFYTYNIPNLVDVSPVGQNGKATPHLFYGLANITLDGETAGGWGGPSMLPYKLSRLSTSLQEVGEHTIGDPGQALFFGGMRDFSVAKDGVYKLTILNSRMPVSEIRVEIQNGFRATDAVTIGLPWPGNIPVKGMYRAGGDNGLTGAQLIQFNLGRPFSNTGTSVQDVLNGNGSVIYQDTTNNLVWVKAVGGFNINVWAYDGRSEESLKRSHYIYLRPL